MNQAFVQSGSLHGLTLAAPETRSVVAFLTQHPLGTGHALSPT